MKYESPIDELLTKAALLKPRTKKYIVHVYKSFHNYNLRIVEQIKEFTDLQDAIDFNLLHANLNKYVKLITVFN